MVPPLDLSRAAVAPQRINLRRAASYSHERAPMSSSSSRLNFNHLIFDSPPPSPGLPRLTPVKRRNSFKKPRPGHVLRVVIFFTGIVSAVYLVYLAVWGDGLDGLGGKPSHARGHGPSLGRLYMWPTEPHDDGLTYDMAVNSRLPSHATPIITKDSHGRPTWTVYVPANHKFPLAVNDYTDLCAKCVAAANKVDELRGGGFAGISSLGGFGSHRQKRPKTAAERSRHMDGNFIDVHEAEIARYLPGSVSISSLLSQQANDGDIVGESPGTFTGKPVCRSSLTFVLASTDAGIGRTVMSLWMAYGQAQKEGRGFFVDDSRWAYGKYSDIFAPPPMPNCRPPLRHEMIPCPREARHLVVTMETAPLFFGLGTIEPDTGDSDHLLRPHQSAAATLLSGVSFGYSSDTSTKHLFELARQGYKALFQLNADDARHVPSRVAELRARTRVKGSASEKDRGMAIGLHIRRGDLHPFEYQYRDSYIPLNIYADRATAEVASFEKHTQSRAASGSPSTSVTIVASDDPTVYMSHEFNTALRAQDRIRLASKYADDDTADAGAKKQDRNVFHKFVDETFGWEGGFYSAMFWNLGRAQPTSVERAALASVSASPDIEAPSPEAVRIRSLVARAYMLDLAVLAGASDKVVCAVSATGCRMLAVMMGWEAAMDDGHWINIESANTPDWWPVDF